MGEKPVSAEGIRVERQGATLVATLSNPGRKNAFTPAMRTELAEEIRAAGSDDTVRTIIVRGDAEDFCSGADLSKIDGATDVGPIAFRERLKNTQDVARAIAFVPKPVVAAVEGVAFGAGLSIALACDIVVAAKDARFGLAFTKIGLMPELGCLFTLAQRVGRNRARRMMLLSETFTGEEAFREGLADLLAEPGQAFDVAMTTAHALEAIAPLAVAATKSALARPITSIEDAFRVELDLMPSLSFSADFKEGVAAFREKRAPRFTGR